MKRAALMPTAMIFHAIACEIACMDYDACLSLD